MTGSLDEISEAIGGLRARVDQNGEEHRATNAKLDIVLTRLTTLDVVADRLDRIEPIVNKLEAAYQRTMGMTIAAGAIGGSGGAGVMGLLGKKLGWW